MANSCIPQPVFMKFHKAGSEGVTVYLSAVSALTNSWKGDFCNTTYPFGHEILDLYMSYGREGIIDNCIYFSEKYCRVSLTTLIRNPIEKFVSYLNHFKTDIFIQAHIQNNVVVHNTMEMMFNRTAKSISVYQMSELVELCKRFNIHQPLFFISRYFVKENLKTLIVNMTNAIYEEATHNIMVDFDAVGVADWLPSYYVLLSKVYNFDLSIACAVTLNHDIATHQTSHSLTQSSFNSDSDSKTTLHDYYPAERLFSPSVLKYLKEQVFPFDIKFWNFFKDLHGNQLKQYGLTVESAHDLFYLTCHKKKNNK